MFKLVERLGCGIRPRPAPAKGGAELRYTTNRRVRETAPGEDDDEHGSHGDYAAGDEGASPSRFGDECTKFALGRYVKGGVEHPHQQHAAIGVVVQPHHDHPSEQLKYRYYAQLPEGEGQLSEGESFVDHQAG